MTTKNTKTPVKQIAMVAHREEGRFDTEQELDIVGAPVGTAERQITFSMGRFVGGVMAYAWGCAIVLDGRKGPTRIMVAMGETFELVMPDGRTAGRYCFTPRAPRSTATPRCTDPSGWGSTRSTPRPVRPG